MDDDMTADEHLNHIEFVMGGRMILTGKGAGNYVPAATDLHCRAHDVLASNDPAHFRDADEALGGLLKRG